MTVFKTGHSNSGVIESCVLSSTVTRGMIIRHTGEQTSDGKKTVALKAAITDRDFGVVMQDGISGDAIDIFRGPGACPVLAGVGGFAIGDYIVGQTDGTGIASAPGISVIHYPIGRAEQVVVATELGEVNVNVGVINDNEA